jgi:hypothetical protein
MPSLHELQTVFMRAILDGSSDRAAELIVARGIEPARRLQVYAGNAQANFSDSLRLSFPATLRLVGEDYFGQCAREFRKHHPSRSGDLQHAGRAFPAYLSQLHGADQYRYLGDVARLEWLCQEALLAPDHGPLDLERLGRIAPDAYDALVFGLHPAARLFFSEYPALRIWESNVGEAAQPEPIDLAAGPDRILLRRSELRLKFYRLSGGEFRFLGALQKGETFAAAVMSGAGDDTRSSADDDVRSSGFDAAAALRRFVLNETIVDFQ